MPSWCFVQFFCQHHVQTMYFCFSSLKETPILICIWAAENRFVKPTMTQLMHFLCSFFSSPLGIFILKGCQSFERIRSKMESDEAPPSDQNLVQFNYTIQFYHNTINYITNWIGKKCQRKVQFLVPTSSKTRLKMCRWSDHWVHAKARNAMSFNPNFKL